MNYLRSVVSDVKLKYRVGRVVYDCVAKREQPEFTQHLTECVSIADGHPELMLTTLHEYLSFRHPENAYGGLLLLEQLVSLCNYGFHLALAKDYDIQDRIIQLAVKRGEGEGHRKSQRLARLTLLEYSRVFVDDRDLLRLSSLASSFEYRTRKSLMRCLNVQNRRVRFRDVDKSDIIPISPKESIGSSIGRATRAVAPLRLSSAPEVWPCHVCTYLNAPSATRCAACETLRSMDSVSHRAATPTGTPRTTPKLALQPTPPTPPRAAKRFPPSEDGQERQNSAGGGSSNGSRSTDSPRCVDANIFLPASDVPHPGPPAAAFSFRDPENMNEERDRAADADGRVRPPPTFEAAPGGEVEGNEAVQSGVKKDEEATSDGVSGWMPSAAVDDAAAVAKDAIPAAVPLHGFKGSPSVSSL